MKKFITASIFLFSIKLFAVPEISFNIPVAMNLSLPKTSILNSDVYYIYSKTDPTIIYNSLKEEHGFNTGFLVRAGENFVFKKDKITGFSVLADLGYYMYSYHISAGSNVPTIKGVSIYENYVTINTLFHTVNLGMLVKINVLFDKLFGRPNANTITSFGIGGGVKIPLSAKEITKIYTQEDKNDYEKQVKNYSYTDIKDMFKYPFIPYIKAMYDFTAFKNSAIGINIGAHLTYSFEIEYTDMNSKTGYIKKEGGLIIPTQPNEYFSKYSFSSFEVGVSIGITLGGFNPLKATAN